MYWALFVLLLIPVYKLSQVGKRRPRMPPGPPTIPILGNALQIPTTGLAKKFREWADKYGPIYSLTIGPTNIIVPSDRKAINQLLEKKGSIYSSRPHNYVTQYVTSGDHLTLEVVGPSWREKRSVVTRNLNPKSLDEKHFKIQEAECIIDSRTLIFKNPDNMYDYSRLYTLSVASTLIYGKRVADIDSAWYKRFFELMNIWLELQEPGANPPIDEFPFLKYLPGYWKKRADKCRRMMDKMWDDARQEIDERRAKGIQRDCFIDAKLDEYEEKGWPDWMTQHAFNNLWGELLEAGADTTANQILTLILALAKYPAFQKKAQAEIDAHCGTRRMPNFSDFNDLPYINCLVKEGMRWRPTAGTGLPHAVFLDDEYEGYLIPKDSMIFVPIWSLHHDPKQYPQPEEFNPDRYLNHPKLANEYAVSPDYNNRDDCLHHYGYGAGRRMCPGLHLAERNMWRIVAKLIWAFDITEPIDDKTGNSIPLDEEAFTSAILTCPLPFNVRLTPRSNEHLAVVQKELAEAQSFMSNWE
ncbi:putative cytochrome P450 oxidoreductase [Coniochaeta ligniaria NRRL 30616]|uniref:Putative cytochrome P450 oxidoreductase n=1 Tax=Coniochaeta ligniaria NRRL 30616 TaxID=1408157 RepID=A0A1J7JXN7_9PEZI|nr:putative cytochrome P450 oxidoreductase [Coniochaeta ligniaria NRRL 30616]